MGSGCDHWFGEASSSDVQIRLDDGSILHTHLQFLRISIPWFAIFFDTAVGQAGVEVELHEDVTRAWILLLRRCYPPHMPVRGYYDAMALVPLIDKYNVIWLRDEIRSCLIDPLCPQLGGIARVAPCIDLDYGEDDGWRRMLATLPERLEPGVHLLGQKLHQIPCVMVGQLVRIVDSPEWDSMFPKLVINWDGFGEMELNFDAPDFAIWLAKYPGCPDDAECCWRHGFQEVVEEWFRFHHRQTFSNDDRMEFSALASSRLILSHYVRASKTIDVLRLASTALEAQLVPQGEVASPDDEP